MTYGFPHLCHTRTGASGMLRRRSISPLHTVPCLSTLPSRHHRARCSHPQTRNATARLAPRSCQPPFIHECPTSRRYSGLMASVSGEFSLQSYPPTATLQGLSGNLPFFSMEQKRVFPEPSPALGGCRRTFQAVKIFPILSHGEAELREENINSASQKPETNPKGMGRIIWKRS